MDIILEHNLMLDPNDTLSDFMLTVQCEYYPTTLGIYYSFIYPCTHNVWSEINVFNVNRTNISTLTITRHHHHHIDTSIGSRDL